jgi:hypothetical protein
LRRDRFQIAVEEFMAAIERFDSDALIAYRIGRVDLNQLFEYVVSQSISGVIGLAGGSAGERRQKCSKKQYRSASG